MHLVLLGLFGELPLAQPVSKLSAQAWYELVAYWRHADGLQYIA
jgi:hypothetical protein